MLGACTHGVWGGERNACCNVGMISSLSPLAHHRAKRYEGTQSDKAEPRVCVASHDIIAFFPLKVVKTPF